MVLANLHMNESLLILLLLPCEFGFIKILMNDTFENLRFKYKYKFQMTLVVYSLKIVISLLKEKKKNVCGESS